MGLRSLFAVGALAVGQMVVGGTADAQVPTTNYQLDAVTYAADDTGCGVSVDDSCCGGGCRSVVADFEATFFRYLRSPGVQLGDDGQDMTDFDSEFAPRVTLGVVNDEGFGVRVRWWEYDESASPPAGGSISVDTYTIDLEVMQTVQLNSCVSAEFSGGARYVEFEELLNRGPDEGLEIGTNAHNRLSAVGGVVGAKVNIDSRFGRMYGGARFSLLGDDKFVQDSDTNSAKSDTIMSMMEIGTGVEFERCLGNGMTFTGRVGYEWQMWENFTEGRDVNNDEFDNFYGGGADVGFAGFVLGASLSR